MSDLLTGQIKDVFTLIDEEQGTIDVASVRQRRATTGTVRPLTAATPVRGHGPRWRIAAAAAVVALLLVGGTLLVVRSLTPDEPDAATTTSTTEVTTTTVAVTTTAPVTTTSTEPPPPTTAVDAGLPSVFDLPDAVDAGWGWVETDLPWHAWNVGRLADGRWAAHSTGWSCTDADGNYLLVDPGGSGDCRAPGVGEIVDPVGTVYTSEDGRSWSVAATVPGVTSALWIGGDLLVGVWVSEFEAEWSVFDGDRLVRSEFFDSIEGSGSSDGASFPLAGTLVWAEYLDGALAVAADMDRVFVANVWQMNPPESWGVFVETSDRWAEYGPEGEPWAGMASDRSLSLLRENPRASVFMYDGFWHVLRPSDGTVWRSGDRRTWSLLGKAAGLPFVGFESQLAPAVHSGQIVEFGDRLVFTAYIDTNGGVKGFFATSTDAVNWTPLEVPDVFGAPPPVWRSQVIDGWLVVALDAVGSTARVIASPDLENWYQFPAPWSGGSGFSSGLGEGVVISRASSGPGELPRTWLAVPPGS